LSSAASVMALTDDEGRLAVRVTRNAGADAVVLPKPDEPSVLLVRVTATPEDGCANEAILALFAKVLGRPPLRAEPAARRHVQRQVDPHLRGVTQSR
jgi:uncharacterized protein YggU (UPF0235/DUF167 family)